MITEDYVSFEVAKLLKENGFDVDECEVHYDPEDHTQYDITQQMAMKWLREVHKLFIFISTWLRHKDGTIQYYYEIRNLNDEDFETITDSTVTEFDSPEKACEAGIKYCLENLI